MKTISDYEFYAKKGSKSFVVQQSGFSSEDAKRRIMLKDKCIVIGKLKRKFTYPHVEGGMRIK